MADPTFREQATALDKVVAMSVERAYFAGYAAGYDADGEYKPLSSFKKWRDAPKTITEYSKKEAAKRLCLNCQKPIGDLAFNEVTILARFGQMLFEHKVCPTFSSAGSGSTA